MPEQVAREIIAGYRPMPPNMTVEQVMVAAHILR